MNQRVGIISLLVVTLWPLPSLGSEYSPGYFDADDPIHIDYDDSLEYPYADQGRFRFDGDLRGGYFNSQVDDRDGSNSDSDNTTLRLRLGSSYGFSETWKLRARLAATCSDSDCSPAFENSRTPSGGSSIDDGDVVMDEFHIDYTGGPLSVALGRLQTRSLSRGGVFSTAMTRLTSPNVAVNWTDGGMLRYYTRGGWTSKLIAQYNDSDGSSTLARAPLDFEDDDSRWSWFYSLESLQPRGPIRQLGLDVIYMPSALLVDGVRDGEVEDYWNLVGRLAGEIPLGQASSSLLWASQVGYAPETPEASALGTGESGDVDGWAWHIDMSWMNFLPRHSIGISHGVTEPGWLLSVSFRPNEETTTLRYHWRPRPGVQLEIQGRWREDREQLVGSLRKRDTFDYRVRLTWAFASP